VLFHTLFTGVAAVAGHIAVAQAVVRHQNASSRDQEIETALGMTRRHGVLARLVEMAPAAVLALVLTAVGGAVAGRIEPLGGVRRFEPNPGPHVNLAIVGIGCVAVLLFVFALSTASAWRRPGMRSSAVAPLREARLARRLAGIGGGPPGVVGLRLAFERGTGRSTVPVASSVFAVVLGVTGIAGVVVFATSRDRLVETPTRFGWPAELVIVDADAELIDSFAKDDRFDLVYAGAGTSVTLEGEGVEAISLEPRRGKLHWELTSGRPPATPDEVVLGTRVADALDKNEGDTVTLRTPQGDREAAVVGVGVLPTFGDASLGRNVAFTPEGLEQYAIADSFGEAGLSPRPGVARAELRDELAQRYELTEVELPNDVRNLDDLGSIPAALGAFLGLLGTVALGHAVLVVSRRRAVDVAMLRVLGFTPRQVIVSFSVMAVATAGVGLLIGVPLGVALGAGVWREVATGAAVTGDALVEALPLVLLTLATVAVALLIAAFPAYRAIRTRPATTLRSE
jgi:hypothetical protein